MRRLLLGAAASLAALALGAAAAYGAPAGADGGGGGQAPSLDDECGNHIPHPPIRVTEDAGPQGFVLAEDTPSYRPGSGVVAGLGTADHPYVIQGWCIHGDEDPFEQSTAAPPQAPDPIPDQNHGIVVKRTDAHVVIRDVVVRNHTGHGIHLAGADNVTVEDSRLVANDRNGLRARIAGNFITGDRTDNLEVRSTNLSDNRVGLSLLGSRDATLSDNDVTDNSARGIRMYFSKRIVVAESRIQENGGQGVLLQRTRSVTVSNSTVTGNSGHGIGAVGASGHAFEGNDLTSNGGHGVAISSLIGNGGNGNTVANNTAEDNGRAGVSLAGASHNEIRSNEVLRNGGHGIRLVTASGFFTPVSSNGNTLAGNTIEENAHHGLLLRGSFFGFHNSNVLEDNAVARNQGDGIALRISSDTTVKGNDLTENDDGINTGYLFDSTLAHNTIDDHGAQGVRLDNSAGVTVKNNTVEGSQGDAIQIRASRQNTIEGNDLRSNAEAGVQIRSNSNWNTVANNTVEDHHTGILVTSENNTARDNLVQRNTYGVRVEGAENVTVVENDIQGQRRAGLVAVDLTTPINATRNWWGHETGPGGNVRDACTGAIADGVGDLIETVDAPVCFDPWRTSPNPDAGSG